jgi:branched-subunit amino acid transport protein
VNPAWIVVLVVGAGTILFKAAGPVFLGTKDLPPRALALVEVLAPAMLAALVVTQAVGGDRELVVDGARLAGIAVAGVAVWLRASLVVVMAVAAAAAALIRLL